MSKRVEQLQKAESFYRESFNSLPFETRKKLACPFDRLREINMMLSRGDNLCMAYLKNRKKELEKWMLEYYKENCNE